MGDGIAVRNGKKQLVPGFEAMTNGISAVQVNPHAVSKTKEVEDSSSQTKNNRKDPEIIANLVKNGNYGMPYPWDSAPIRSLTGTRCMNRWYEGSWDDDPLRHGRFTIIADRG